MKKSAKISNCGKYRYWLNRTWDEAKPTCVFVMLNPSVADAKNDDPTIRRCIKIAEKNNCGSLEVVNLFAYRATDRSELRKVKNPIGKQNDEWILKIVKNGKPVILAWGNDGKFLNRGDEIRKLFKNNGIKTEYLKLTKLSEPCHPLIRAKI